MPPRRTTGGGIAGPASAMTAYLREQGIVGRAGVNYNPNREAAGAGANAQAGAPPANAVAGPSSRRTTVLDDNDEGATPQPVTNIKRKKKVIDLSDSDDLDNDDIVYREDDDQEDDKPFVPPQRAFLPSKKARSALDSGDEDVVSQGVARAAPSVGSVTKCGECKAKVTVTKYSPPSPNDPSTVLCRPCAVKAGLGDYKGPNAGKKGAAAGGKGVPVAQRRKIIHYEEKARILTLKDICIELIARNVDHVDSLGDIGAANMDKVNDIICRHRKMTSKTAQLFYDVELTRFMMKDCTNIGPQGFLVLANLCPSLTSLTLNLCGQLSDESLVSFATKLPSLKRIELLGPFLVRKPAWIEFLTEIGPRLEGFLVRQSPRLDDECIETLVRSSGGSLRELRLSEMGKMDESWLGHLARLRGLTSLDLSYPLIPLPAESTAFRELIAAVGPGLTALNLAGQSNLTSADLLATLPANLPNLTRLDLTLLDLITDEEMVAVLTAWAEAGNVGLESVKIGKAHLLLGPTLDALVALAGESLQELEISGWKDLEEASLKALGHNCPGLTRLDIGWCRNLTDFTLKEIFLHAEHLREVVVWGCNSLTQNHPRKKGVKIIGVESHQF